MRTEKIYNNQSIIWNIGLIKIDSNSTTQKRDIYHCINSKIIRTKILISLATNQSKELIQFVISASSLITNSPLFYRRLGHENAVTIRGRYPILKRHRQLFIATENSYIKHYPRIGIRINRLESKSERSQRSTRKDTASNIPHCIKITF